MRAVWFWLAAAGAALPALASGPGGALTLAVDNRDALSRPAPGLDAKQLRAFQFGNRLFNTNWIAAPGSVTAFDGLGPTFNRVSCSGCHLRDGRGRPPAGGEASLDSMLLRISVPGADMHGGPKPHPTYGDQINDRANPGVPPEMRIEVSWDEVVGSYVDGETYRLRRPRYRLHDFAFGALGAEAMVSPRVAPAMVGLGLVEAIPEATLLARADPDDANGDGISGRANRVHDPVLGDGALGRFGWKANVATLLAQSAGAARGDIGLTSRWAPEENCPAAQDTCMRAIDGGTPELTDAFVTRWVDYLRTLAVPARRRADDAVVARGAHMFADAGCGACHTPAFVTGEFAALPLLANQAIAPYSDFLLHDLGPYLADGRPDFGASGDEWRTAPLWGSGLVPSVNGHDLLLHDGRARGYAEAILWHGGEAQSARERFRAMPGPDRNALVTFLGTL
jgi:CxxC motif-containing protein (DUF1111 family)